MSDTENNENIEVEEATKVAPVNPALKWYIVKGASGREKTIAELIRQRVAANNLQDKIVEVVVPTQEKVVIKRGKKTKVTERIYPGYILIQMEVTDDTLHLVRNTEDVQGFVGVGYMQTSKQPKPLSKRKVQGILAVMEVKQEPVHQADFAVSDAVKVVDGPFKDFVGTVQEVNANKGQVTVLLSIFGRETPVHLDFLQVTQI